MNYNLIAFSRHRRYMNKLIAAVPYGKQLLFNKVLDSHFRIVKESRSGPFLFSYWKRD